MVHRISNSSGLKTRGVYVLAFLPSICVTERGKISCMVNPKPIFICINKVLLAYSYTHSFAYCLWQPLCCSYEFSEGIAERACMSPKALDTDCLVLGRKHANLVLESISTTDHSSQSTAVCPRQQHTIKDKEIHFE